MSRGLGRIQRDVLTLIEGSTESLDTYVITRLVYGIKPDETGCHLLTEAQIVAVRRALRGLAKAGKIARFGRRNTKMDDGSRVMLNREHWVTPEKAAKEELEAALQKARLFGLRG
jgi:hypothetical protein